MAELTERLFNAIKNDNVKEFNACMGETYCGSFRLGRFPVLSVMYLYKAKKLLRAHEKTFLKHNSWQDVGEPLEISAKFRQVAGKCLRLYLNETVSPLEMLLLLNMDGKMKKAFAEIHVNAPVKQRLKDIYRMKWGLDVSFSGNRIILQRRPLTRGEKQRWALFSVCIVLCVALIAGAPFVVNIFAPFMKDGDGAIRVSSAGRIKFASEKIYSLNKDITLSEDFFVEEFNCELRGNGHTITTAGTPFGTLNGKIADVKFQTQGVPVVDTVVYTGVLESVEVAVNAAVETTQKFAFVANNNYGTLKNINVNVCGSVKVAFDGDAEADAQEDFNFGGVTTTNGITKLPNQTVGGSVSECTVTYDNFSLVGEVKANAAWGGVVGTNNAFLSKCEVRGAITSDTLDIAGVCASNYYLVSECNNYADLTQITSSAEWNPIAVGIVANNYNKTYAEKFYPVWKCNNYGNIVSQSTCEENFGENTPNVIAAGIVHQDQKSNGRSEADVLECINEGKIKAVAAKCNAAAAGIGYVTTGGISDCQNHATVECSSTSGIAEVAGIAVVAYGYVNRSLNSGELSATTTGEVRAGGIAGTSYVQTSSCLSEGKIFAKGSVCYVGGVLAYAAGVLSGGSMYCGTVLHCIFSSEISLTTVVSAKGFAAVGGIVGYMEERELKTANEQIIYRGGIVVNGFFTGKISVGGKAYIGGIVGVLGKNIYLQIPDAEDAMKFRNNLYYNGCGANTAFGAVMRTEGDVTLYESVTDSGAEITLRDEIFKQEVYRGILDIFDRLPQ